MPNKESLIFHNPDKRKLNPILIIGIIGSILFAIGIFYTKVLNKDYQILQQTVFVTDINGNVVLENEGELNIPLGNRSLNAGIGEDGRTNFGDIPIDLKGDSITIGLKAEGWEIINNKNKFVFTGNPIILKIRRDNSLGLISGVVKSINGQEFIAEALVHINNDTILKTNDFGIFRAVLPKPIRLKNQADTYLFTVSKEGYKTVSEYYSPLGGKIEIRLQKQY